MKNLIDRITILDDICNGKPTIRGMRITVQTILEFILVGDTEEDILEAYPILELDDIKAVKLFALNLMNNNYSIKEIRLAA